MKKYCTHRYMSLIVRKFPIEIKKKYRNALILTQDTSNQSCRVRLTHARTERYILIVSTLRVNFSPEFVWISIKFSPYDPLTKIKSNAIKHAIQNSYPLFLNENPIQFYQKYNSWKDLIGFDRKNIQYF